MNDTHMGSQHLTGKVSHWAFEPLGPSLWVFTFVLVPNYYLLKNEKHLGTLKFSFLVVSCSYSKHYKWKSLQRHCFCFCLIALLGIKPHVHVERIKWVDSLFYYQYCTDLKRQNCSVCLSHKIPSTEFEITWNFTEGTECSYLLPF